MVNTPEMKRSLIVTGLMSGTSLDGTDLASCEFTQDDKGWNFRLLAAETIPYPQNWEGVLRNLHLAETTEFLYQHHHLGRYFGALIHQFILSSGIQPDYIGSHGHTIFHQPQRGFTAQIGDGAAIAALSGIDTICDFRSKDIILGGQGAPLVPIGDQLLFGNYAACLNLGGIANISFEQRGKRMAYDICPANMPLNLFASKLGSAYDEDGRFAQSGTVLPELLEQLNNLGFYRIEGPRSLGKEWFEEQFLPLLNQYDSSTENILRTITEHIAIQHAKPFEPLPNDAKILVTGGGAFNRFLIERITKVSGKTLVIPDQDLVKFKEAIVFAFLAALFVKNQINVLSSATGSVRDHIGGALYKAG
ncbi:anhydro-N-acetylmuramic acid kinase [soil metagenome]